MLLANVKKNKVATFSFVRAEAICFRVKGIECLIPTLGEERLMGARKAFSGAQEYGQVMQYYCLLLLHSFKSRQGGKKSRQSPGVHASRQIGNLETNQERIRK